MAEGRMLKRNISDSRRLAELKTDSARLLWTWIIPYLDVEGRYFASTEMIKGKVVPRLKAFTEKKINECLVDMSRVGLIVFYEVDGEKFIQYRRFGDFQSLRKDKEGKPLPGPEEGTILQDNSGTTPGVGREDSGVREVKRREVKRSEANARDDEQPDQTTPSEALEDQEPGNGKEEKPNPMPEVIAEYVKRVQVIWPALPIITFLGNHTRDCWDDVEECIKQLLSKYEQVGKENIPFPMKYLESAMEKKTSRRQFREAEAMEEKKSAIHKRPVGATGMATIGEIFRKAGV